MDSGSAMALFFLNIWRLFELESPFFGLKVWQILIGLLVCELGVGIFHQFFCSLFDVSADSREQRFERDYQHYMSDKKRSAMSQHMNFRL